MQHLLGLQIAPIWAKETTHDPDSRRSFSQRYASDPCPPHTRQKYEQTSGQNMTPNAFKTRQIWQFGGHIFVHMFVLCVGVGVSKRIPIFFATGERGHRAKKSVVDMVSLGECCFGTFTSCYTLKINKETPTGML